MTRKYILVLLIISIIPLLVCLSGCKRSDPTDTSYYINAVPVNSNNVTNFPVESVEQIIDAGDENHSIKYLSLLYKTGTNNARLGYDGMDLKKGNIIDYGGGVYYFKAIRANFGNMLAQFIEDHTNLELTTISPDVIRRQGGKNVGADSYAYNSDYGVAAGYFVIFREKELKANLRACARFKKTRVFTKRAFLLPKFTFYTLSIG